MSGDGSLDPHYVSEAGAKVANGTYLSCGCADLTSEAAATPFAKAFQKLAKFPIGTYSGEAYDATNAIIQVMKSLGTNVSRAGIVTGLHKVTYIGLDQDGAFPAPTATSPERHVHLYGKERQDRRRRLGPLTLAHRQDE